MSYLGMQWLHTQSPTQEQIQAMALVVSTLAPVSLLPDSFLKNTEERNLSTKCFRGSFSVFQGFCMPWGEYPVGNEGVINTFLFNRKVLAIAAQCKASSNQRGM